MHQSDERLRVAEGQAFGALLSEGGGEAEVLGQVGADGGDDRADADVSKEFAP